MPTDSPDYLYYYDAFGRREAANNFGVETTYLFDTFLGIASNTNSAPVNAFRLPDTGEVWAYGSASSAAVPLNDVLGSTIGLVGSNGTLATQFTYTPFGEPTVSGQGTSYPYLMAGIEYDYATGLYHTPARYYNAVLQRFLSEDPLDFQGSDTNLFAYAKNDPSDLADRSGSDLGAGEIYGYCAYGFAGDLGAYSSLGATIGPGAGAFSGISAGSEVSGGAGNSVGVLSGVLNALTTSSGPQGIGSFGPPLASPKGQTFCRPPVRLPMHSASVVIRRWLKISCRSQNLCRLTGSPNYPEPISILSNHHLVLHHAHEEAWMNVWTRQAFLQFGSIIVGSALKVLRIRQHAGLRFSKMCRLGVICVPNSFIATIAICSDV